jgi:hypothetical protein
VYKSSYSKLPYYNSNYSKTRYNTRIYKKYTEISSKLDISIKYIGFLFNINKVKYT